MYKISKGEIVKLSELVESINNAGSNREIKEIILNNVEDTKLFIDTIRKIDVNRIKTGLCKFSDEEIHKIFEKSDGEIKQGYSIDELREIFEYLYVKDVCKEFGKEDIILMIRRRLNVERNAEVMFNYCKSK